MKISESTDDPPGPAAGARRAPAGSMSATLERAPRRMVAVLAILAAGVALGPGGAAAQQVPDPSGGSGSADPSSGATRLEVTGTAQYAVPVAEVLPDTVTTEFPPGVICILFAEPCSEQTRPAREPANAALDGAERNQQPLPAQPTPPDGLTMTLRAGEQRYLSAVRFELPTVPEGEQVSRFLLRFPENSDFTYHSGSPAFRQAVLAAVAAAGAQDPAPFIEEFQKAFDREPLRTEPVIGLEACPLTAEFQPTEHPQVHPAAQLQDDDGRLRADCTLGANGTYEAADGSWTFDLGLAARAWNEGELANRGIVIRPAAAPQLAYGDPDPTTNVQVVLRPDPTATVETAGEPTGLAGFDPSQDGGTSASLGEADGPGPATTGNGSAGGAMGLGGSPAGGGASGPGGGSAAGQPAPVVAPEASAPPTGGAQTRDSAPQALPATTPISTTNVPWWVLLLLPVLAGGAWTMGRSLAAEVVPAEPARDGGAMTRLLELRGEPPRGRGGSGGR